MENEYKDIEILEELDEDTVVVDVDDAIKNINTVFENLDPALKNLLSCPPMLEEIEKLRAKNWNQLTNEQREQVLAEIHTYLVVGFDNVMDKAIYFSKEYIKDPTGMTVDGNRLVVDEQLFKRKNYGFTLLSKYLHKIRETFVYMMISSANELGINPIELDGKAKEYYMNLSRSILMGSWSNELSTNDVNYNAQPVVVDGDIFVFELIFDYVKHFYKKDGEIDKECSDLLNNYIMFYDSLDELLTKRKEVLQNSMNNVEKMYKEHDSLKEYLQLTASDLTNLSDDDFYQLFNAPYYLNLCNKVDDYFTLRLENLANGLLTRTFKDYDTSEADLPRYFIEDDLTNNGCINLIKQYKTNSSIVQIFDFSEIFSEVLVDISEIASDNLFFEFKNEKEKNDCLTMKEWMDSKDGNFTQEDNKIRFDGLNVISLKLNELISNMVKKIDLAISKSKFKPAGMSAIKIENKESLYDYHEFKNGLTKEEVTEKLLKKVKIDLARGGR